MGIEDFSKLKVAELKQKLSEQGLSTSGKKDELVARLQEAAEKAAPAVEDAPVEDAAVAPPATSDEANAASSEVAPAAEPGERASPPPFCHTRPGPPWRASIHILCTLTQTNQLLSKRRRPKLRQLKKRQHRQRMTRLK